ncbi:Rdx family-domain-containing protein [Xylogone sp. PMI_703]|nr:Rdx family-domain-containing protein [Xylogone sp. PMI_703]
MEDPPSNVQALLPRVTIQFCTQCKWMLRAAYFAQELLSTFNTALGEVALQPSTGGTFIVTLYHSSEASRTGNESVTIQRYLIWDRKAEGGFPETKELKRRIRDVIDPSRDLGHVDRHHSKSNGNVQPQQQQQQQQPQQGQIQQPSESKLQPEPQPESVPEHEPIPQKKPSISIAASFSAATPPPIKTPDSHHDAATNLNINALRAAAAAGRIVDTPTSTPTIGMSELKSEFIGQGKGRDGEGNKSGSGGDSGSGSKEGKIQAGAPGEVCEDCG